MAHYQQKEKIPTRKLEATLLLGQEVKNTKITHPQLTGKVRVTIQVSPVARIIQPITATALQVLKIKNGEVHSFINTLVALLGPIPIKQIFKAINQNRGVHHPQTTHLPSW